MTSPATSSTALPLSTAPAAHRLPPLILACLAATWLVWGSTHLAIKFALVSQPPFLQMGSRCLVAGLILGAWMRWRGAAWPSALQRRNAGVVGVLLLGGGAVGACTALMVRGARG